MKFIFLGLLAAATFATAADRPNILWITSEDNSPYLGCYGDPQARTPRLDRLATQGVRYRNAFATSPVCSSARSTLITGMHASTLGVLNHRSSVRIPDGFQLYPHHLRAAGYYCTNNAKTDYNVANPREPWDASSAQAHYKNRPAGQPFFAIFNLGSSHESQVAPKGGKSSFRIAPEKIVLPPYHPDTPQIRRDWANYYDQMTAMDAQAGALLDELEKSGLADDTIVFYYSDHGGALPRGKRNIHDSGTRVPLIIRFPQKWAHLAPAKPGEWIEQPVSFVDLPVTLFSLTGAAIPEHYQGRAFLGEKKAAAREHVFLYRARMDERYDTVRAVRDREFRYVRNYSPHRPWGQHQTYAFQVQPSMRSWFAEFEAGRCNEVQAAYWKPKPAEEFYEIARDPHELRNLVADSRHAAKIAELRRTLRAEMIATRDTAFIPEGMFAPLAGEGSTWHGRPARDSDTGKMPVPHTIYDYAQSAAYPIERIIELADKAASRDAKFLPELMTALDDAHPVIRYWGATGCLILQSKSAPAKAKLQGRLKDEFPDVRIVAAEALGYHGESAAAIAVLGEQVKSNDRHVALAALNALEYMWRAGHVPLARAQALVRDIKFAEPLDRIPAYLLGL